MRWIMMLVTAVLLLAPCGSILAEESVPEFAFVVQPDTNLADIQAVRADGTGLRTVISNGLENTQPRWSPDGTRLVYRYEYPTDEIMPGSGELDVMVANADGSNPHKVANLAIDQHGTWSPDGRTIAFEGFPYPITPGGFFTIYTANADGNAGALPITNFMNFHEPDWNGDQIVASGFPVDEDLDIYIMNASGGNWRVLAPSDLDDYHPVWSPNGQMVAFIGVQDGSDSTEHGNIYVVQADGSGLRKITIDDVPGYYMPSISWSPDSTQIAYTSAWGETNTAITPYVHIADLNSTIVEYFPGCDPVWSPDGVYLAFVNSAAGSFTIDLTETNTAIPSDLGFYVRNMATGEIQRVADTQIPDMTYLGRLVVSWRPVADRLTGKRDRSADVESRTQRVQVTALHALLDPTRSPRSRLNGQRPEYLSGG